VGIALIAVGGLLIGDVLIKPAKLMIIPFAFFGMGGFLIVVCLVNMIGAYKTNRGALKVGIAFLFIALLALGGVLGLIFLNTKKAPSNVLQTYMTTMDQATRTKLHDKFKCCGMDDVKEATQPNNVISAPADCKFNVPCYDDVKKELDKKLKMALFICAGCLLVQVLALFGTSCLLHKVNKGERKQRAKQKHVPLAEQFSKEQAKKSKGRAKK
jgi:hypothetical protein